MFFLSNLEVVVDWFIGPTDLEFICSLLKGIVTKVDTIPGAGIMKLLNPQLSTD